MLNFGEMYTCNHIFKLITWLDISVAYCKTINACTWVSLITPLLAERLIVPYSIEVLFYLSFGTDVHQLNNTQEIINNSS